MSDNFNFLDLVSKRQSERSYLSKPVEREKIIRCIEAARLAPSACNSQPWKFIIVDDPDLKNAVAEETSNTLLPLNHFTKQAPVHIVVVREKPKLTSAIGARIKDKDFSVMDIGIATGYLCLQAVEEGLGTCILGWFNEKNVKNLLKVPVNKRVELIITIGYPGSPKRLKKRKNMEQIIRYNYYTS